MNARRNRRPVLPAAASLAVAVSLAGYAYALWTSPPTQFDDSYMFIRYANNILAGYGHAWNPGGEPVYGSTSLLHVAVVVLWKFCLPRAGDATILLIASALPGAAALAVLVATSAQSTTHRLLGGNYLLWAGLLLPSLVFNGTLLYHHGTGMDTMLSMLCNALLIFFTMRLLSQPSLRRTLPVVLCGYLAFLARPDNGVYATLFPLLAILLLGSGPRRRPAVALLLGITAVLAADCALKWQVFGTPLPLPFFAKQQGIYQGYVNPEGPNPFAHLQTFLTAAAPFACLVLLLARRATAALLAAFLLPVAVTFGYYFSVHQIMGMAARFYVPSLPFLVVPAALVLDDRLRAAGRRGVFRPGELWLRLTVLLLIVAVGRHGLAYASHWYQGTLPAADGTPAGRPYRTAAAKPLPPVDRWQAINAVAAIARGAPQGTVIALSEHGLVGAAAPQTALIDLVGLHDRQFALHGFSAAGLLDRRPDLIWLPPRHYAKVLGGILGSDKFRRRYVYYPGAFDCGIALRKDSVHSDQLRRLMRGQWKTLYGDLDPERYRALPADK